MGHSPESPAIPSVACSSAREGPEHTGGEGLLEVLHPRALSPRILTRGSEGMKKERDTEAHV